MLRFFAGDVAWATGHLVDPDALDPRGAGYFQFQNGVQCIVNGSTGGRAQHLFELLGSKGWITVDNTRPRQFKLFVGNKEEKFPEIPEEHKLNTTDRGRCVIPLSVEEIVESLDRDRDTISTGEDGRAALEMVLSLHESERLGNARVDFPMRKGTGSPGVLVRTTKGSLTSSSCTAPTRKDRIYVEISPLPPSINAFILAKLIRIASSADPLSGLKWVAMDITASI